jgi:hypothetical protein
MSADRGMAGVRLWESLTAILAQIADRNLPGWDAGEMATAAKSVVERSDWLAELIAADRERIAKAIENISVTGRDHIEAFAKPPGLIKIEAARIARAGGAS